MNAKKEEITSDIIKRAREKYLELNSGVPSQFNLSYSKINGFKGEFQEYRQSWNPGFRTCQTHEVLELFFSCNPKLIDFEYWVSTLNDQ